MLPLRYIGSSDSWFRWLARKNLERLPIEKWKDSVFSDTTPRSAIEGMMSLCTVSDDKVLLEKVADKSLALLGQKLPDDELLDLLRVIQVAHIKASGDKGDRKGGSVTFAADAKIAAELSKRFSNADWRINHELARLMIYLNSPDAKNKILAELEKQRSIDEQAATGARADEEKRNQPRENQIHYAYCLGAAKDGWTDEQKKRFAAWFEHALKWQGGNSFKGYLEYILRDWQKTLSEDENTTLLAWYKPTPPRQKKPAPKPPPADAKKFTFDEMVKFAEANKGAADKGKVHYEKQQCARCHKYSDASVGGIGPDLTTVSSRMKRRDMLEATVEPSKIVSDQFKVFSVKTKGDEQFDGFAAINNAEKIELVQATGERVTIPRKDVASVNESKLSLMPAGLLEGLSLQDIADLLAFMESSWK